MRKIKRKNQKSHKAEIKRVQFIEMLKKIYLSGAIRECLIVFDNGRAMSEAIDITNSMIVLAESETIKNNPKYKMASNDFSAEIGLGDVEILIKFLSSVDGEKINISMSGENRVTFSSAGGKRKMIYLLTIPEMIPTRLRIEEDDDTDYRNHYLSMTEAVIEITQEDAKNLISYINLSRSKLVDIAIRDEIAVFTIGSGSEHKFSVEMDLEKWPGKNFEIQVDGKNIATILSNCIFAEDDPTTINLGEEASVVILDATTFWSITTIEDDDEFGDD
jgi:hypothetical protein